jgi:hypothetical protein
LREYAILRVAVLRSSRLGAGLITLAALIGPACSAGHDHNLPGHNHNLPRTLSPAQQVSPVLGINGAAIPVLQWRSCGRLFQCATATVPLDYNQPHGAMITLSVIRLLAADPVHRIGSLFVNFGGPGTPGVGGLRRLGLTYPEVLRQRFDLVSFDPRGVGGSTPVRCTSNAETADKLVGSPVRPDQQAQFFASSAALGHSCAAASGELLAHTSSVDPVRNSYRSTYARILHARKPRNSMHFLTAVPKLDLDAHFPQVIRVASSPTSWPGSSRAAAEAPAWPQY